METYPSYPPTFPRGVKGVATVQGSEGVEFTVDFNTGECDCQHGKAWRWTGKKYLPNPFCTHKMRALASLTDMKPELSDYYYSELGRRYNVYVAVSAFHKELRRGRVEPALYWATVLTNWRGKHGVIAYMRNIVFEETRDLELFKYILKLSSYGKSISLLHMQKGVERFCKAPKKWELPWRLDLFLDEQRGYKQLVKDFGKDVAKPQDIIDAGLIPDLHKELVAGFAAGDRVKVQYGLKGFLKAQSKHSGDKSLAHGKHKIDLLNYLIDVYNKDVKNAFDYDEEYTDALYKAIMHRVSHHGAPGYHELNAFCDALTGEPGADPSATLTPTSHKIIAGSPVVYAPPLADVRRVPQYANDNHTWHGKALMRKFGETQLQPGADQTDIDFRLCGAYMGVAWRLLAHKQRATIDCKWGDVSWKSPNWLWGHLDRMWY